MANPLKRFDKVYPACGSRNSAIELSIPELEKYFKAVEWINIGKTKQYVNTKEK